MTEKEIMERVYAIERICGDDEAAHSAEDQLYEDLLRFISEQKGRFAGLAKLALKTKNYAFERWCA